MSPIWGKFHTHDIARVIEARDGRKSDDVFSHHLSQVTMIATLMEATESDREGGNVKEILGANSQWKMWLKVEEKFVRRYRKRDENDEEENAAWTIWCKARTELKKLEELEEKSMKAS